MNRRFWGSPLGPAGLMAPPSSLVMSEGLVREPSEWQDLVEEMTMGAATLVMSSRVMNLPSLSPFSCSPGGSSIRSAETASLWGEGRDAT